MPLFGLDGTVKLINVPVNVAQFVIEVPALGPKQPVKDKFQPNKVLAEVNRIMELMKMVQLRIDLMTNFAALKYMKN